MENEKNEKKYTFKNMLTLVISASALTCVVLCFIFLTIIGAMKNTDSDRGPGFITPNRGTSDRNAISGEAGEFFDLLEVIDERFIGAFDLSEITDAAMRAAVESLDDDWSYYMSREEYEEFMANSNNQYRGIGVEVVIDDDTEGMKILGVYADSGAGRAGIVIGDIITAIDGESIIGLSLPEIRIMLRRDIGETARITVLRESGVYEDLTVTYDVVYTNPISFMMLDNNIGYINLRNFEEGSAHKFIDAVNELITQGAVSFIYDVRSNPGGRVGEVTGILDFLLPEGEIFITVDRSGVERITESDASFINKPAVVIVNEFSYSGAEFFAAMLCEYNYADTVGTQTTGKNRMQTTIPLPNGGAVHISTGHYLTKNRVSLFDVGGFTPRYIVEMTDDEMMLFHRRQLEMEEDPQLLKALSLLTNP